MRVAVVVFPGTNCEHDVVHVLGLLGAEPRLVWHRDRDLTGFDAVVLPGGFAHGDYLRTGAIARFSPIMAAVERLAASGRGVLGICNGFQMLCEAGLLPGGLVENRDLRFICRDIHVRVVSTASVLTRTVAPGAVLQIPLNSYKGNYTAPAAVVDRLEAEGRVVLRYCGPDGTVATTHNPNGSTNSIAGITNEAGNVVGLMPHPERAAEAVAGGTDGRRLLESFVTPVVMSDA